MHCAESIEKGTDAQCTPAWKLEQLITSDSICYLSLSLLILCSPKSYYYFPVFPEFNSRRIYLKKGILLQELSLRFRIRTSYKQAPIFFSILSSLKFGFSFISFFVVLPSHFCNLLCVYWSSDHWMQRNCDSLDRSLTRKNVCSAASSRRRSASSTAPGSRFCPGRCSQRAAKTETNTESRQIYAGWTFGVCMQWISPFLYHGGSCG